MKAYSELALLLSAPAAPVILRADALGGPRGGGGGRWRRIFSVSVEYLENTAPQPKDVERAEAMLRAAAAAGADLAGDGSLDMLTRHALNALCSGQHAAVVDTGFRKGSSPHAAYASLLRSLGAEPWRALARLSAVNRARLLESIFDWICGPSLQGPHPSVAASRGLMKTYAGGLPTVRQPVTHPSTQSPSSQRRGNRSVSLTHLLAWSQPS